MPIDGTFSIYRFTDPGDTETSISDKVEFSGNSVVPDAKSFINHVTPIMSIIGQENQTPGSNNPSHLDETGLAFVGLEITGYFIGNETLRPFGLNSITNWLKQGQQKTSDYPHGRFGFRNNIDTQYNLAPSATSGYLLEHFECDMDYTNRDYQFLIKLRYQNRITDMGS
jgi:hypothetical protein